MNKYGGVFQRCNVVLLCFVPYSEQCCKKLNSRAEPWSCAPKILLTRPQWPIALRKCEWSKLTLIFTGQNPGLAGIWEEVTGSTSQVICLGLNLFWPVLELLELWCQIQKEKAINIMCYITHDTSYAPKKSQINIFMGENVMTPSDALWLKVSGGAAPPCGGNRTLLLIKQILTILKNIINKSHKLQKAIATLRPIIYSVNLETRLQ